MTTLFFVDMSKKSNALIASFVLVAGLQTFDPGASLSSNFIVLQVNCYHDRKSVAQL